MSTLKYIIAVALYGTVGFFLRYVSLPVEVVSLCRGIIGTVFMFLYMKGTGRSPDREAILRNLPWLIISGICLALNWLFLLAAYLKTSVAVASLCNYIAPAIVVLIAPVLLHEPLNKKKLPCVAVSLIGIILVCGVWNGAVGEMSGVILALAAALGFVGMLLCNRKITGISDQDKSLCQMAVITLTVLPYVLVKNIGVHLQWDRQSVLIILMLGIVHTGIAYSFYFSGIGKLSVQTIAVLGYLEPVVAVLCSAFLMHEAMGITGWIGAILIIGSAVVSECVST